MAALLTHPRRAIRRSLDLLLAVEHLRVPVAVLIITTIIGTIGYTLILDLHPLDGLYQAVLTLSTVGFMEIAPFDNAAKLFTIGLVFFGVGTVFYGITMLAATVVEGEVRQNFRRRIMMRRVETMQSHIILCGYGRVGEEIARMLSAKGREFVVVDQSPEGTDKAVADGYEAVCGNAEEEETLGRAGISHASGIIAATTSDASNTYITLTARALKQDIYIVARSNAAASGGKLELAGANRIISPNEMGARRMALSAMQPMMADFMDALAVGHHGDLMIAEFEVEAGSPLDGTTLAAAFGNIEDTTVLGIRRADLSFQLGPRGGAELQAGDIVILMASEKAISSLATHSHSA